MNRNLISCLTCGVLGRYDSPNLHCWQHGQCRKCHYFGIIPKGKISVKWEGNKPHNKVKYHYSKVTSENIELYCKLSQIIRNKPCRNKKLVLLKQYQYGVILP